LHAGLVFVADGSERAERRLERVLSTDPGMGVARHVDAGYDISIQTAKEKVIHIPMIDKAGDK
ncbi:urocanate hydratase, partial [Staphylococcus aureus]|nr:urocanate hydratase [Staphylococcus aureus]